MPRNSPSTVVNSSPPDTPTPSATPPSDGSTKFGHVLMIGDSHLRHSSMKCGNKSAYLKFCPGGKIIDIKARLLSYVGVSVRDFSKFDPRRAASATADWKKVTQLQGMLGARLQSWELRHPLSCLNVEVYLREVVWTQFFSTCTHQIFLHVCKTVEYIYMQMTGNIEEAFLRINSDLERISQWSHDNGLKLNVSKCTVIHLAPHNLVEALSYRGLRVTIGGESLTACDSVKTRRSAG
ncbi:hypothetical protein J6590_082520 [Homalodisca vitripennis]|nr:hypothetical protein J6590_082520 [Homalodisca vitripennis]